MNKMDWTRGHTIGRGSSATVSLATTAAHSGGTLAVKSAELQKSQFLQREQQILSKLNSPHIVGYKGCDVTTENNNLIYNLFMEYVPGGTISDAIRRRRGGLEESTIRRYTGKIVQGLEYIHSNQVVHCDIKGSNILIGENGPQIADFGCAKMSGDGGAIGGTPAFMAPEVARGEEQGAASDIWSLGCTVIEMATGGSPWPQFNNPIAVLYRIAFSRELPEIPNFLSSQARDFLGKCLRRDPKERWTAKELLNHPFLVEFKEFDSNSPTSVLLDHGFWSSLEEPESDPIRTSCSGQRIGRLSCSGGANWAWDESWITVRSNNNGETNEVCGSMTALITTNSMEMEDNVKIENLVNFRYNSVNCSNSGSNVMMSCTCTEHDVVLRSLDFGRDREIVTCSILIFL